MNENVNVCITPKGEKPVLHFSQYDNERVFTVTVLADDGESAAVLTGLDIEFRLRKTDSHVVTIAPESVADNVITFKTTEQLCACCGQNIASVTLMKDDMNVSTLDILVDIQRDILSGGLTSESDIRNLTSQIEQIVPEVIGDDYYNKQEVDDLLAEHTFDPSNYYDKSDVDELIAEHTFDPSNYYNKSDVDNLLGDKADADDVYTKTETDNLLSAKMDNIGYHGVVDDAAVISFTTDCNAPLDIIKGKIDPNPSGFSALNVTRTGKNLLNATGTNVYTTLVDGVYTVTSLPQTGFSWYIGWVDLKAGTYIFNGGMNHYCRCFLKAGDNYYTSEGEDASFTLTSDTTVAVSGVITESSSLGSKLKPMIRKTGESADFEPYNGQTATVNFGQSVTIGGVFDLTNGKITLSDDTEISVTPVTVSSIAGDNNIYIDTGNLTEIAYFENAEDNLIKLIKACQI